MLFPIRFVVIVSLALASISPTSADTGEPDPDFHFSSASDSPTWGYPDIPDEYKSPADPRSQVVAADQNGKCASMNRTTASLPEAISTAHVVPAAGYPALDDQLHHSLSV